MKFTTAILAATALAAPALAAPQSGNYPPPSNSGSGSGGSSGNYPPPSNDPYYPPPSNSPYYPPPSNSPYYPPPSNNPYYPPSSGSGSTYLLTSYLTPTCGTVRGVTSVRANTCTQLSFPARSLQFRTSSGIPRGCTLVGYLTTSCSGISALTIVGQSQQGVCYQTANILSGNAYISSIGLSCRY